ncbi:hypothetical protein ACLOJK_026904, partial [Asimina triloba]
ITLDNARKNHCKKASAQLCGTHYSIRDELPTGTGTHLGATYPSWWLLEDHSGSIRSFLAFSLHEAKCLPPSRYSGMILASEPRMHNSSLAP